VILTANFAFKGSGLAFRGLHKTRVLLFAGTACVLALRPAVTLAQVLPGAVQPGRDRPAPSIPSQPDFDFSIESPHRSTVGRAVDQVEFTLKDVRITGAKAIPASNFRELYEKLLGKEIRLAAILDVADQIEQSYRNEGYLLVRAYVPPQRVRDGIFTINVVEGHIAHVTVEGGKPDTQDEVRAYIQKSVDVSPLPLPTMERSLLLANDLPGVSATGVLHASADVAGASDLVVSLDQPPVTGGLAVDNRGSRFSGLWTLNGDVQFNSVFGNDQLAAVLTTSPDASEQIAGQVRYRRAIGDDGVIGSLNGTVTHGEPGSTLAAFGVLTDSWAFGPRVSYPIIRTRAETLQVDAGFTAQDAHIDILGTRISHDQWRVMDFSLTYLRNWLSGSWLATVDLAQGIHGLGATPNGSALLSRRGGETDFTKFTGLLRYTAPLIDGFSAVLTGQGQYSTAPLINGELISFGGLQIGRGYDPGGITGDHGLGGSAELRYDTALSDSIVRALEPYVYVDAARTWYIQRGAAIDPALMDQSIASIGTGVRLSLPHDATLGFEVSHTLDAVVGSDAGKRATKFFVTAGIRF
jgi:hemolysin activation/secretion protein